MTNSSKLILANDFLRDTGKAVYVWFYLFYQLRFMFLFYEVFLTKIVSNSVVYIS